MVGNILMALVAGAIVGPLARFVLPGRQHIGVLMTVILGAIGSVAGAWLYKMISGRSDTPGIDWIEVIVQIVVAAIGVSVVAGMYGRKSVS